MATPLRRAPDSSVGIKQLKDQASEIVESVRRTRRPVTITKNNREVARIVPISTPACSTHERLAGLGLLATRRRDPLTEVALEKVSLDASVAIEAIRADREGG